MDSQIGVRALLKNLKDEAPDWAEILPSLPRKIATLVDEKKQDEMRQATLHLIHSQKRQNFWLGVIALVLLLMLLFNDGDVFQPLRQPENVFGCVSGCFYLHE